MLSNTNRKGMFNIKQFMDLYSSINLKFVFNAIGFQMAWFICVQGNNLNAVLTSIGLIIFHQFLFKTNLKAWPLLIAFSLLGYLGDSVIASLLQVSYSDSLSHLAPLWLLSLWLAFATTLDHSMRWIFKTPVLTVLIAIFVVPISYLIGIKLSGSVLQGSYGLFYIIEGIWWGTILIGYQRLLVFSGVQHA